MNIQMYEQRVRWIMGNLLEMRLAVYYSSCLDTIMFRDAQNCFSGAILTTKRSLYAYNFIEHLDFMFPNQQKFIENTNFKQFYSKTKKSNIKELKKYSERFPVINQILMLNQIKPQTILTKLSNINFHCNKVKAAFRFIILFCSKRGSVTKFAKVLPRTFPNNQTQ